MVLGDAGSWKDQLNTEQLINSFVSHSRIVCNHAKGSEHHKEQHCRRRELFTCEA